METTVNRVPAHTAKHVNARICQQTQRNIAYFTRHPDEIEQRMKELDAEWDIERVVEAQSSSLILAGVTLGVTVDRRFLILPGLVAAFLLQHAIQGWCPPIPLLRRLGVRTQTEIEAERCALLGMRKQAAASPEFSKTEGEGETASAKHATLQEADF